MKAGASTWAVLAISAAACADVTPASTRPAANVVVASPQHAELTRADAHAAEARRLLAANEVGAAMHAAFAAFQIRERWLGAKDARTCDALELVAEIHAAKNEKDRAEQALLWALAGREAQLGPNHPTIAAMLDRLAELNGALAEERRRRALAIREVSLGPLHPITRRSMLALAATLRGACRLSDAEALAQRALDSAARISGPTSTETVDAMEELATLRSFAKDHPSAFELRQRIVKILEPVESGEWLRLTAALASLSRAERHRGRLDEARQLLERALSIHERWDQRPHGGAMTGAELAMLLIERGDVAAAQVLFARFRIYVRKRPGAPDPPPPFTPHGCQVSAGQVGKASEVVAAMAPGFRRCYQAGLASDREMKGNVRVIARIDGSGGVASLWAVPTLGSLSGVAVQCVGDHVFEAKFEPPAGGGATIVIPVIFTAI